MSTPEDENPGVPTFAVFIQEFAVESWLNMHLRRDRMENMENVLGCEYKIG